MGTIAWIQCCNIYIWGIPEGRNNLSWPYRVDQVSSQVACNWVVFWLFAAKLPTKAFPGKNVTLYSPRIWHHQFWSWPMAPAIFFFWIAVSLHIAGIWFSIFNEVLLMLTNIIVEMLCIREHVVLKSRILAPFKGKTSMIRLIKVFISLENEWMVMGGSQTVGRTKYWNKCALFSNPMVVPHVSLSNNPSRINSSKAQSHLKIWLPND